MHASIACLLLHEDYVWVSFANAMNAKQSKASSRFKTHHVDSVQIRATIQQQPNNIHRPAFACSVQGRVPVLFTATAARKALRGSGYASTGLEMP
jgi:hypothetical protein